MKKITMIIGGSGLVGSRVIELLATNRSIIAPTHKELDITNPNTVHVYIQKFKPDAIVNFAANSNIEKLEKERGNKSGPGWCLNVIATDILSKEAQKLNTQLIQISTDAVFPGTETDNGPYKETAGYTDNLSLLSWYGITKIHAEKIVFNASQHNVVIRISYPFGNTKSSGDLVNKTLAAIVAGKPIFTDQTFTPTFIDDLALALDHIISDKHSGFFHVASPVTTSRWDFAQYVAKKMKYKKALVSGVMKKFLDTPGQPPRTRLGGLSTISSQKRLSISFTHWKKAIDMIISRGFTF